MRKTNRKKLNILFLLLTAICFAFGLFFCAIPKVAVAEESVSITNNGSRLVATTGTSYAWSVAETVDGEYAPVTGATAKYYDIMAADENRYIKVTVDGIESEAFGPIGKLVVFDLAKSKISFASTVTGVGVNGESVSVTHKAGNIYVVRQSENATATKNGISVSSSAILYDITLDGVNIYETFSTIPPQTGPQVTNYSSMIHIPASSTTKVVLRIKGENSVRGIHYYTGNTTTSSLKITDVNGDNETSGYLYIPKKVETKDIDAFVSSTLNHNHWNAGIGGDDGNANVRGLTIAGANVQVLTTASDNCTAIGAGGNGYAQINITGGAVVAHANGTGAAIGGGIGWNAEGGSSDVTISGGKVYAKNHALIYLDSGNNIITKEAYDKITNGSGNIIGGVAIGAGSSVKSAGSTGGVTITGGSVEAYGTAGNAIGGGNSSASTGGQATVKITGGKVVANTIGGGNSKNGTGGKATVTVDLLADVTLTGGIGGGDSISGAGGEAKITVNGGVLKCGGGIGGGNGGGNGAGGNATIEVTEGTLTATTIGGGLGSGSGNGGTADVTVEGGKLTATTIGGGNGGATGKLGKATANVSGGEITGQFIMAEGAQPCVFTMTGGTLYGVNTKGSEYAYKNGGAVYVQDPKGEVNISGGTIRGGVAENGGAIYMLAGKITLSGTAKIENCNAAENGGAIALGGGEVYIRGGSIENNAAKNGGGVYLEEGNVYFYGGSVENNQAAVDGGGVYIGSGNFHMENGSLRANEAVGGNGGGAYVRGSSGIQVNILSGTVEENRAKTKGGAVAVVGNEETELVITIGVKGKHFEEDAEGNLTAVECDHSANAEGAQACPVIQSNAVTEAGSEGGAFYITGSKQTQFNVYCLLESGNTASGGNSKSDFMKVDGGTVVISSLESEDDKNSSELFGNVVVEGTFHVAAGVVYLKGTMSAPKLLGAITVDVDKSKGDDFVDDRTDDMQYFVVQYFEDFNESGRYTVFQVADGTSHTVASAMYGHSGYQFVGWFTKDGEGNFRDEYTVGETVTVTSDLKLYAKWDSNVYFIVFDPNVPAEKPYYGVMEKQQLSYTDAVALTKNAYEYYGFLFLGWHTDKDALTPLYEDEQVVEKLSATAGASVTLYAVWEACPHLVAALVYSASGNVLTRSCNCKGFSESATVQAKDAVYDGNEYPATVAYSLTEWELGLTISYEKKNAQTSLFEEFTGEIKNAGTYRASITAGGATASLEFVIHKAKQAAPLKPTYETKNGQDYNLITIKANDGQTKEEWQSFEYRIAYYEGSTLVYGEWSTGSSFELNITYTNYFSHIRFAETENYEASEYTMADAVYFFGGDDVKVTLTLTYGEGVSCLAKYVEGTGAAAENGIKIDCTILDGYYPTASFGASVAQLNGASSKWEGLTYSIFSIPNNSNLVVHIDGAKKKVTVTSWQAAGEVLGEVAGDSATVGNDSAYTLYYKITDFSAYGELKLVFDNALPVGTTALLIDKSKAPYTYWYYLVSSSETEILLAEFSSIADKTSFTVGEGELFYQIILDFSRVAPENLLTVESLKTDLTATGNNGAPAFPSSLRQTGLKEVQFALTESTPSEGASSELSVLYAQAEASVSKWEDRQAALVLSVAAGSDTLPLDAAIEVVEGQQTIVRYRTGERFILPLRSVSAGQGRVQLTLLSDLFPVEGGRYLLNAELYGSYSEAGGAPLNASVLASYQIEFIIEAKAEPALRVTGETQISDVNGSLTVQIERKNLPSGYTVSADVQHKNPKTGVYSTTGLRPTVESGERVDLVLSFEGLLLEEGSYRVLVTIKDESGSVVLSVPYYFILRNL